MSTPTSAADTNYFSVATNVAYYTLGQAVAIPSPLILTPSNPASYDAILKVCDGTSGLFLLGLSVSQGMENAIDCNNGAHHCAFNGNIGVPVGAGLPTIPDQVITVKGACHDLLFKGTLHSRGRIAEIVVGAWSDQSHDSAYSLDFSQLAHSDGQLIRFVFGRVKHPLLALIGHAPDIALPRGAKVLFWKSLGEMAYWWGKWILVKAGVL